ncbi:DUF427-domain-containing protein [Dendrothele bispora CBS 962.96]|uniref:DUF427-domain-containing protein n=1 Tax=Dendrothele bispora (strain CBS 962.96) TaxID=1314807 RepID=A0A4S8MX55_DENBC|nr:DUF427-domain-containing protein [Dendrothele bispora CBS 962.96]
MAPPFTQPHVEDSPRRIRVLFGGRIIVDTRKAKLVWEHPYYPHYYFLSSEVPSKFLDDDSKQATPEGAITYDVTSGDSRASKAATVFPESYSDKALVGLTKITFSAMHAWFEEDEQIFVHPKDPYKRVDVLQSSRNVRVEVNGVEVANTNKPRFLYETSLPVRTYIPKTDCRLDLLVPSTLTTACPYKGVANYYNVQLDKDQTVENIVWWYRNPNLECAAINGFVAFYDEKVDVWIDGEKQERPATKWS